MLSDWIRDTSFGFLVRTVSRGRFLQFPDVKDPESWKRYVNEEKSEAKQKENREQSSNDDTNGDGRPGNRTRNSSSRSSSDNRRLSTSDDEKRGSDGESPARANDEHIDLEKGPSQYSPNLKMIDFVENDPDNPRNWTRGKKFFVTFLICFLTTSVYIGSAIYSPGVMDVEMKFQVSQVAATLGLSLFVAGYGVGPMLWAPMSEIPQVGRNPVYIGTLFMFVMLQIPTALATNFGMLLAFRFLTGFFGSPVLATGGASIGDMYSPAKRAYGIGIWGIAAICGPVLGPLVGGFVAQAEGWTWTIWVLMWLSGLALVVLFFFLPETSANNILYRRTVRLRQASGIPELTSEPEITQKQMTGTEIAMTALVRPITLNFLEPMVFLLNLYIALIYGLLYIWFESFPLVFTGIYHFNLGQEGLAFLGILVGALITLPIFAWYLHRYLEPKFNENGEIKPELRLQIAMFGCWAIPICLFWFGWSSRESIHWIMPIIGSGFFAVGAFLLFQAVLNYLSDAYPEYAASVLAGNDLMRSSFGTGFPLFAAAMYRNLGIAWASSTLAFLGLAFCIIPFWLYKYGENLRKNHSKYARKDL